MTHVPEPTTNFFLHFNFVVHSRLNNEHQAETTPIKQIVCSNDAAIKMGGSETDATFMQTEQVQLVK